MEAVHLFELLIAMLFAVVALHWLAHRLHLPPAVALIAGGAALAFIPGLPPISLDPELVLVIFLPPLLMDGAWFMALRHLRRHLIGILSLAIGAVLFTTLVVAVVTHWLMPSMPWAVCAALGAIVSPPDAVSARAILQRVRLPQRLSILLEGESLLNDATGLVLFRIAIAAAVAGNASFSVTAALGDFALLALGGAAVGAACAAVWVFIAKRLTDEYLVIAISVLLCWATFIAAEFAEVSGVIACVVCGLICGWYQHRVFSATVRLRGVSFWNVMVFLLEASVFLLIGSSLREIVDRVGGFGVVFEKMAVPILWIVLAMTVARFVWIFACDGVIALRRATGWKRFETMGWRASTVLSWAGMRGVVTLAVALSVSSDLPRDSRDFLLVTAFAVILITVLVQGMTLGAVIKWLRPPETGATKAPLNMSQAELAMARVQVKAVEGLAYDSDGTLIHPQLLERYQRRAVITENYAGNEAQHQPRLQAHFDVVLAAVGAARQELLRLHREGQIDDHVLHELERDLDLEELGAIAAKAT
jgi:CPA1 family monovalent cation:H+ antiporter